LLFAKEVSEIAQQSRKSFGIKPFPRQFKQQTIQNNNLQVNARNPKCTAEIQRQKNDHAKKRDIPGSYFSLCANDVVIE